MVAMSTKEKKKKKKKKKKYTVVFCERTLSGYIVYNDIVVN